MIGRLEMHKVSFFNPHHNGDLFTSKEYVRQVVSELDNFEITYYHNKNFDIFKDLNILQKNPMKNYFVKQKKYPAFIEQDNELMINTHISVLRDDNKLTRPGINYDNLQVMWLSIFEKINDKFKTNLQIKDKLNYINWINFDFFSLEHVNIFLKRDKNKKVLIVNNVPQSKQSFTCNMKQIIENLASRYINISFIITDSFDTSLKNIYFTDNITKRESCDLVEISYISEHCNIIVGKNSGPFIFCITKNNIMNKSKTIISLNNLQEDSLLWNINFNCNYIWDNNYSENNITEMLDKVINKVADQL